MTHDKQSLLSLHMKKKVVVTETVTDTFGSQLLSKTLTFSAVLRHNMMEADVPSVTICYNLSISVGRWQMAGQM